MLLYEDRRCIGILIDYIIFIHFLWHQTMFGRNVTPSSFCSKLQISIFLMLRTWANEDGQCSHLTARPWAPAYILHCRAPQAKRRSPAAMGHVASSRVQLAIARQNHFFGLVFCCCCRVAAICLASSCLPEGTGILTSWYCRKTYSERPVIIR